MTDDQTLVDLFRRDDDQQNKKIAKSDSYFSEIPSQWSGRRKLYETKGDLGFEREILKIVEKKWGCSSKKLQKKYQLDYLLLKNDPDPDFSENRNDEKIGVAWLEIKNRSNPIKQYPTFMLSMAKIMTAQQLSEASGLPSFVVVRWADAIGYTRIDSDDEYELDVAYIGIGGRTDRNDAQDIEPLVYIRNSAFTLWKNR